MIFYKSLKRWSVSCYTDRLLANQIARKPVRISLHIINVQNEWTEKYQFNLCSKDDREHDFDVVVKYIVARQKLRWTCRNDSNNVSRQVEIPGRSTMDDCAKGGGPGAV